MARKVIGHRKTEHLGIPLDRPTKRRLVSVAKSSRRRHTEVARDYIVRGIEHDERRLGLPQGTSE